MKQTNYTLYDFLDVDPSGKSDEILWRACTPEDILERDGVIEIKVPFQKQMPSNEITPDMSVPQQTCSLKISALGNNILRITVGAGLALTPDKSEMLEYDPALKPEVLSFEKKPDEWLIRDKRGVVRAVFNFREQKLNRWSSLVPDP